MDYISECLQKFKALPQEYKNRIGNHQKLAAINGLDNEYNVDMPFLVILVAIGELYLEDLPEYLEKKFKIEPERARQASEKIKERIFNDVLDILPQMEEEEPEFEELIGGAKEVKSDGITIYMEESEEYDELSAEQIKKLFAEGIKPVLKGSNEEKIKLNSQIILALTLEDMVAQEELSKMIYLNSERITSRGPVAEGKTVLPTIGNWIKDFIKVNGSGIFTNIELTEYLTKSENVKALSPEEKEILSDCLKIYKNVKFFPESQLDLPPEEWEIFPIKTRVKRRPMEKAEFPEAPDDLSYEEEQEDEQEAERQKMLATLERMTQNYPRGHSKEKQSRKKSKKYEIRNKNY